MPRQENLRWIASLGLIGVWMVGLVLGSAPGLFGPGGAFSGAGMLFAQAAESTSFQPKFPLGIPGDLWSILVPAENPMTSAKVELGRKLYFDKRLSADNTVACSTCHDAAFAFADEERVAVGIKHQKGARNSPTVLNAVFNEFQFWDGRAPTLEEQAKQPLTNPVEMGMPSHDAVVSKLKGVPEYVKAFKDVFGGEITIDRAVQAIAAFERTLVAGDSSFDRFVAGDQTALSDSAKRGWNLFQNKGRCISCHAFNSTSPFFTDNKFHNIGVAMNAKSFDALARKAATLSGGSLSTLAHDEAYAELGRFLVSRQPKDIGAFKTPGLRNVALTPPYLHDGSQATLADVVDFYDKGGEPNPNLDGGIVKLNLTAEEKGDLVEFMKALTSDDIAREAKSRVAEQKK
ncbi:MAG: cytochrome-c peroxidase [Acidobacteriia bacterium]|nr:cytochrome-c peroxidase [Terriglobia bacterium]